MLQRSLVFLVLAFGFGCVTSKVHLNPSKNRVVAEGVFAMSSSFVKVKRSNFFVEMLMRNERKDGNIIVHLYDLECSRGDTPGTVRNDRPFNIGEKTIDFGPGQVKAIKLRCVVPSDEGEMSITASKVYDNPSGDRKTPGKVLAKDVRWKLDSLGD